ncbi:hypothetical protein C8F01DRAFT_490199 [Mycena amicta]|nr:hypothetical protein C8F01DRAFT_490199 [Mycena amicta]
MDVELLDRVMGAVEGVGKVDHFVGQLSTGWRKLRDEQRLQLGLPVAHRRPAARSETGRIQHHIVFLGTFATYGFPSPVYLCVHPHFPGMKAEDLAANDTPRSFCRGFDRSPCGIWCDQRRDPLRRPTGRTQRLRPAPSRIRASRARHSRHSPTL